MIAQPPRHLRSTALWQAIRERPQSLFVGSFFTLVPIVQYAIFTLLILPHFQNQDFERIRTVGKAARGEVTRIEIVRNFTVNGDHPKRVFSRYKADGAERDASMETLSAEEVSKWQKGQPIEVRYLGGRGRRSSDWSPSHFPSPSRSCCLHRSSRLFFWACRFSPMVSRGRFENTDS